MLTATQLQACGNHPVFNAGTIIRFTNVDGTTSDARVGPFNVGFNSATINIQEVGGAAFQSAQRFVATRTVFVGEDPVTCTGFTATQLTGCTWPAGTGLALNDPVYTGATTNAGTPLISGWIKIEAQRQGPPGTPNVWADVTLELLNLGFAWRNQQGDDCGDPTQNAVIRLIRLRDNGMTADLCGAAVPAPAPSTYHASQNPRDYWPLMLFDARES